MYGGGGYVFSRGLYLEMTKAKDNSDSFLEKIMHLQQSDWQCAHSDWMVKKTIEMLQNNALDAFVEVLNIEHFHQDPPCNALALTCHHISMNTFLELERNGQTLTGARMNFGD